MIKTENQSDRDTSSTDSDEDLSTVGSASRDQNCDKTSSENDLADGGASVCDVAVANTPRSRSLRSRLRRSGRPHESGPRRRLLTPIVMAVLMVAALITVGTAYITVYRDDQASSTASKQEIVKAATDGTVALLSYSPASLETDFTKAKTYLTGQFLTYYQEFTTTVVQPAATENGVETKAQVVRSGVSKHDGNNAEVLAFVNQSTTSKPKPDPELSASSVRITLQRVDGRWLISSFDPV